MRWPGNIAAVCMLASLLGGCATGEHVYVSGRDQADDDDRAADDEDAPLLMASAEGVLIARGNALLPGALIDPAASRPIRSGPAGALVSATLLPRGMTGAGAPTAAGPAPMVTASVAPAQVS
ncbi:MAG: hypothetical protein ABW042_01940, partial [Phenylobacterium sp.]